MRYQSESTEQTAGLAESFIKSLIAGMDSDQHSSGSAKVVGLYGDLGSGKTTFVQSLGNFFALKDRLVSPTFVIEKIYKLENQKWTHLIHIDAYRLEKSDGLVKLGWKDLITDEKNLIFIEWPEKVADIMPEDHIRINFTFIDEHNRAIEFENYELQK
jgi:tRNA threonylcarbamoyladenosine biosynthesis protein TsaE